MQPNNILRRAVIKPTVTVIKSKVVPQQVVTTRNQPNVLSRNAFRNNTLQPVNSIVQPAVSPQVVAQPTPSVVQPKYNTVKERINSSRKQTGQVIKRPPPVVTSLQPELTPAEKEIIKNLRGTGQGKYLAILGNGPSLADIDTTKLKNINSLFLCAINVPDDRVWPTQYWAFYDRSQYHRHKERYFSYTGMIFNSTGIREPNSKSIKFRHSPGIGYSHDPSKGVYIGMSSVYATIQIATFMNFDKIFVLGCDMNDKVDVGRTHFYGVNPDVEPNERRRRFEKEANWYNHMAENVDATIRSKIVFCSKGINTWPFMNSFHSVTPSETIDFILGEVLNDV